MGWSGTWYVAKNDVKVLTFLPLPQDSWKYSDAPPCLISVVLRIESKSSCMLDKHFTHWDTFSALRLTPSRPGPWYFDMIFSAALFIFLGPRKWDINPGRAATFYWYLYEYFFIQPGSNVNRNKKLSLLCVLIVEATTPHQIREIRKPSLLGYGLLIFHTSVESFQI